MRISRRFSFTLTTALLLASGSALSTSPALALIGDDGMPPSFSGSYLAGRSADQARDVAPALEFYADALTADPDIPALTDRLLLLSLANGDMDQALALATHLTAVDTGNPAGRLAIAVHD